MPNGRRMPQHPPSESPQLLPNGTRRTYPHAQPARTRTRTRTHPHATEAATRTPTARREREATLEG